MTHQNERGDVEADYPDDGEGVSLLDLALPLVEHRWLLVIAPLVLGASAYGLSHLVAPTFTATTTFMPPQQQQSSAASALASLGALSGLAGAAAGVKSPADQYVALMQSTTVENRLIDRFKLIEVYDAKFRVDARKAFEKKVRINVGKKDGLITVEVDDTDPQRAADIANRHVDELRRMTSELAITEAQQRRVFFERQLNQTKERLTAAQQALQGSGFNPGALRAEPKAAAEGYAKARAEVTAAEIRLQSLRRTLADSTPEVQQASAVLSGLRAQLSQMQSAPADSTAGPDYVGKYREFKYQETLFDLFARQYEVARLDESREGALIQVVDTALPPEKKSKPQRALIAVGTTAASFLLLALWLIARHFWRESAAQPETAEKLAKLRAAMGKA
jgi:uncharacterized protein involved in exopolysaccharide biosynthesis